MLWQLASGKTTLTQRLGVDGASSISSTSAEFVGLWDYLDETRRESDIRWHVLEGLRKWEASKISVTKLRNCLNDPDPEMRASAASVAGEAKVYAVRDDLVSLVGDDTPLGEVLGGTVSDRASRALDKLVKGPGADTV